jgi:hypothetical protein
VNAATPVSIDQWIPVATDFGIQPSWSDNGRGIYYFSIRDGAYCAWLQPLDPTTKRPAGPPRAVQHLHHPRLRAAAGAMVTNDVRAGYLYVTLTETTGNIWMMAQSTAARAGRREPEAPAARSRREAAERKRLGVGPQAH